MSGDIGSDHLPITTTLSFRVAVNVRDKLNMNSWAEKVNAEILLFKPTNDVNENIEKITQIFKETKKQSTYSLRHGKRSLPPEIVDNIRLRKTLLNSRKKASSEIAKRIITRQYNRLNHKVQRQMREFEDSKAEKLASDICNCQHGTQMWKLYNKYKNNNKPMEEPEPPLINPDGLFTSNDKEKSDEFARHLRSVHQTPDNPNFDNNYKAEIDDYISNLSFAKAEVNEIRKICVPQFRSLLQVTKSNSAPGEDQITYDVLKLCSDECIQVLCNLFNQCLEANVFPEAWKTASVKMLVKPGKNKNEACSYRPISLLSCLGNISER